MEAIPERVDSKFRFVLLASDRAEQMMRGATPKLEKRQDKVTRMAMQEIIGELVQWDYGSPPEEAPPEEEPAAVAEVETETADQA